jgi:hypothetical protein
MKYRIFPKVFFINVHFCSLSNNLMPIKIDWDSCIPRHRFVTKINNVEQHASFFYLE